MQISSSKMYWENLGLLTMVIMFTNYCAASDFQLPPELNDGVQLSPEKSARVIESIKKLGELYDKADIGNKNQNIDCGFYCPTDLIAVEKPKHKVYPDGCGNPENKLDFPVVPEIIKCCDTHDICYGTFGKVKQICDKHLHTCMETECRTAMKSLGFKESQEQGCKMMSKLLFSSMMSSSCDDYKKAQQKAILCETDDDDDDDDDDDNDNDDDNDEDGKATSKEIDEKSLEYNNDRIYESDDDFVSVEVEDSDVLDDEDVINIEDDLKIKDEL
ncbi:uncharacterized protein [Antedon mediterranea]|uniref:uncharacterized protein n=1 Tax=Antedon mediterranea TaxID=105859 RepID=UPI003AF861D2